MAKKLLYSFNVYKEVEVERRETIKGEDGSDLEVIKKVKEQEPIKILVYKPSKRQMDDANFEYGKYLNKMMNAGFLTKAMLTKKYADSGGALTKDEGAYLNKLSFELDKIRDESIRIGALKESNPELQKEWEELRQKDAIIRREILELESSYRTLFEHTADSKAEAQTILWFALFLSYIQENKDKEPIEYFVGDDFDEKLSSYYEKEESEDPIYKEIREKLFLILSFWWHAGASEPKDFEPLEEELLSKQEKPVKEEKKE